ncbi:hypothetical protein PFNF54_00004 [Plasmodium falciparum NF54]|uniref:Erythrocyte membrane protein 1 n=1 Tax=Plasmodium falciparum (isolate NF54) TaxID=5843 RepID=W7K1L5_PLAFO|nr:hypothetical protein PFNF54_00004 [Plasmodium falciparum NF54]
MVTQSSGGGAAGSSGEEDAKHVLDEFGQQVYNEKVEKYANSKIYKEALKGDLSQASILSELAGTYKPCALEYEYYKHTNGGGKGKRYPCTELGEKVEPRFSDTLGGQCTNKKIEGNKYIKGKDVGACAPYRRLHLCSHNLESIQTNNYNSGNAKHNLLVDVCMAAKYEGDSIKNYYPKYQRTYPDTNSQLCTVLARSFADIGDIVRGKDLYLGNPQESTQRIILENNLKDIFAKIHSDVMSTSGSNGRALQKRYKDTDNYYELREDWWALNRDQVWKAITCNAGGGNRYFRQTCGSGEWAKDKCRCKDDKVPTYFDYVPQYLRWFEEWAEDFCRLRKHKLKDAKNKCRGDSGNDRYCDLNRYDCTQTIRGNEHFVEKDDCKGCQYSCAHFVNWIDNQKLEFEKQKEKYTKEIKKKHPTTIIIKTANRKTTINNLYVKEFYKKLQEKYGDVENFLQKLNEEQICKNQPYNDESSIDINFKSIKDIDIFSHTEYCQACPWCGAKRKGKGWEPKEKTCGKTKTYDPKKTTNIPILTPYISQQSILKKYNKFCNGNGGNGAPATATGGGQIKNWQCHYEGDNNDNCVEGEWKEFKEGKNVMSYNAFFWKWVHDMLIDSMQWRNEHGNCINKDNDNTCKNSCKRPCECFKRWVDQKKKNEWEAIKDHFKKQNIAAETQCDPGVTLQWVLILDFLKDESTEDKENKVSAEEAKEIKHLRQMLQQAGVDDPAAFARPCTEDGVAEQDTIMDKLLNREENDATECKKCDKPPPAPTAGDRGPGARADPHDVQQPRPPGSGPGTDANDEDDDDDDDDDDEEDGEAKEEEEDEEKQEDVHQEEKAKKEEPQKEEVARTPKDDVNVCNIVNNVFTDGSSLQAACSLKYGKNAPTSWKCVTPSGNTSDTTVKSGDTTGGSICVPPRRRRLYVTPLTRLTGGDSTTQASQASEVQTQARGSNTDKSPGSSEAAQGDGVSKDPQKALLKAFVESAAVETFFLWDRYKKIKEKEKKEKKKTYEQIYESTDYDDEEKDPQEELKKGIIPDEFKRQMFYTLGDYKDILYSGDTVNGGNEDKIKKAINNYFQKIREQSSSDNNPSPRSVKTPSTSDKDPQTWWNAHAPSIWNAMVCALTYDTNSGGEGKTTTITQDPNLKTALWDENGKKPLKTKYQYDSVTIGASGAKPQTKAKPTGGDTPLTQFVLRPTYFRYLEEWGQNFCKKRTEMLEKIKYECKVGQGRGGRKQKTPQCSCYGENCDDQLDDNPSTDADLKCPGCGRECRKYKKWIEKKKEEFTKQSNVYEEQKTKCQKESKSAKGNNHGNEFCGTQGTCDTAGDFLNRLKSGPCKKENGKDNQEDEINFKDEDKTFGHENYCAPCPVFKDICKKKDCRNASNNMCNGKDFITAEDIKIMDSSSEEVNMLVSDNDTNKFDGGLDACKDAHIFKGIKENKWSCGNVCGYNVCKPKKVNGEKGSGENNDQIITIRGLVTHWVQNFLDDYNKIRTKLKPCRNNGEVSKCIKDCVKKWVEKKTEEWPKIRDRYLEPYKSDDGYNKKSLVRSFMETLIPLMDLTNGKEKIQELNKFLRSYECNCADNSQQKGDTPKDIVECLLEKLEDKANKCKTQTSGTDCHPSTPLEDDDEPLEETEENTVEQPNICPTKQPQPEKEDGCEAAPTTAEETSPTATSEGTENQSPPPPPPAPAPAPAPAPEKSQPKEDKKVEPQPKPQPTNPPPNLFNNPAVIPALMSSTIMWSIGIALE